MDDNLRQIHLCAFMRLMSIFSAVQTKKTHMNAMATPMPKTYFDTYPIGISWLPRVLRGKDSTLMAKKAARKERGRKMTGVL